MSSWAVVERGGKRRAVKNCGWLLRHWRDVEVLDVAVDAGAGLHRGAVLTARLQGGGWFQARFADSTVLRSWLQRPVFRGVLCYWRGAAWGIASWG